MGAETNTFRQHPSNSGERVNPLQKLQRKLLSGAMVCEYTDPRGYQLLMDADTRQQVIDAIEKPGYELKSLGENTVFFLTDLDEPNEPDVKAALEDATRIAVPIFVVFDALVRCAGDDLVFSPGYVLDKDVLLMQVNKQDALKKNLETVVRDLRRANQAALNNATLLDIALKKLLTEGYLVMDDVEKERYRVTGKVCYLQQMMDYIAERQIIDIPDFDQYADDQAELDL